MRKRIYRLLGLLGATLLLSACARVQTAPKPEQVTMSLFPEAEMTNMVSGQTIQFTAILESGESQNKIVWKSQNEAVAVVNDNGEVTAMAEGETVIGAAIDGQDDLHAEVTIKVLPHTEDIAINETQITVLTGSAITYLPKCSISPANAYYQGVNWTSSDESIAVVGADGSVFGIAPGKCTFTGTSEDPECTKEVSVDVTVKVGIESIALDCDGVLYVGKNSHIKATILPDSADKSKIVWASSDESIATVDAYGNVMFAQPGSVTITCKASDGSNAESSISVEGVKGVYALHIDQRKPTLLLGATDALKTIPLTCSIIPADTAFTNVSWESDNPAVAEVDENGYVTARTTGKATITASSKDPAAKGKIHDSITLSVGNAIEKITLNEIGSSLFKGYRYTLNATTVPASPTMPKLKWSSSDDAVIKVDGYGNLQARSVGQAVIRCEATDGSGVYTEKTFTVIQPVQKLSYNGKRLVVTVGKSEMCEIKVFPENASKQTLHYTSTNPNVASVNALGLVSGVSSGECTIIARSTDGSGKEIRVPVICEPAVPVEATSLGRTGYNGYYNEFTVTYTNVTSTKTVTEIGFTLAYDAGKDSGQADFTASGLGLTPGRTLELGSWKASGLNFVDSFTIYLNSITYSDGSVESFSDTVVGTFRY